MRRLIRLFDVLAARIDAKSGIGAVLVCWMLFVITAFRAGHRLYWYDELLTVKIAALPRMEEIWAALRAGLDLNPPFQYLAVRGAWSIFGNGPIATRLPVIIGFLVMSLCIFRFLRKRVPVTLAFAGMLLPWLTGAYQFALDARPYGILLGCSGVVLLCWSEAAGSSCRGLHLAGLGTALFVAFSTHCYAVMMAIPLAAGELVRLRRTKRPDWMLWSVMAVAGTPVLLYPALMHATKTPVNSSWPFYVNGWTAPLAYAELLEPLLWPVLAGIVLVLLTVERGARTDETQSAPAMPAHELAAVAGFAAIPAGAVLLSAVTSGAFALRYGAPGVVGIACLAAWAINRSSAHPARHGAVLALVLLAFFTGTFGGQLWAALRPRAVQASGPVTATPPELRVPGYPPVSREFSDGLPIVIASGMHFLEIEHAGDDALLARTYYLMDIDVALRRTGAAWFDLSYPSMQRMLRLRGNLEPAAQFLSQRKRFLLYSSGYLVEWLPQELLARGWHIRLLARSGFREVTEVTPPE